MQVRTQIPFGNDNQKSKSKSKSKSKRKGECEKLTFEVKKG